MTLAPEPKPCPQCGRKPCIIVTMADTFEVLCFDHRQTVARASKAEAIVRWNADDCQTPLGLSKQR